MKKLITLALIGIVSVGYSQSKLKDTTITITPWYGLTGATPIPNTWAKPSFLNKPTFFIIQNSAKPILEIETFKDGKNNWQDIDMVILKMDKKNFRWLNDSTAVLIKP